MRQMRNTSSISFLVDNSDHKQSIHVKQYGIGQGYSYQRFADRWIVFKSSCFIEESILLIACYTRFKGMGGGEIFLLYMDFQAIQFVDELTGCTGLRWIKMQYKTDQVNLFFNYTWRRDDDALPLGVIFQ